MSVNPKAAMGSTGAGLGAAIVTLLLFYTHQQNMPGEIVGAWYVVSSSVTAFALAWLTKVTPAASGTL